MKEVIGIVTVLILGCAVIMAPIIVFGYFMDRASCRVKSVSFEAHEFSMLGGCMVKHEGKWIPLASYRVL